MLRRFLGKEEGLMQLTAQDVQAWLAEFTDKIKENKQYLSDLDTPIGDGDHGNNILVE